MQHDTDLYLGTWQLVPELSLYAQGEPPAVGVYVLSGEGDRVQAAIRWRMPGDEDWRSTGFSGAVDDSRQALEPAAPGAPDAFSLRRVDARTLDSAAWAGETRLAWARRRASADGALLAVVQEGLLPDGGSFRNFQVYRRIAD